MRLRIVGRGMLASAFARADSTSVRRDILIFASGISNSTTNNQSEFDREAALLREAIDKNPNSKLVYFSSCGVLSYDTPYYRHKFAMEAKIAGGVSDYLVCRLPQVVGRTENNTFFNYILKCIKAGDAFPIAQDAVRNLIDVDDVVRIVLLLANLESMTIPVVSAASVRVDQLVRLISDRVGKRPVVSRTYLENIVVDYDSRPLVGVLGCDDIIFSKDYLERILSKYC